MFIYSGARAADVRALAGAIVLGSSAGLMLGGAYLLAGPKPAVAPTVGAIVQAAASASGSPSPAGAPLVQGHAIAPVKVGGVAGLAASLRDRFGLNPAARPFAFARIAAAPTDLHCLAETVYFEARGESTDGQEAVAQVVLNRVRHPAFPKTICAVVHQRTAGGCQFTFACSSREAATDSVAWRRAETVASAALHGAVMAAVGDATHFQTVRSGSFAGLMKVAQIGAHVFYRFAGHQGATAMFRRAPLPSTGAGRIEVARLDPSDMPAAHVTEAKAAVGSLVTMSAVSAVPTLPRAAVVAVRLSAPLANAPARPGAPPPPAPSAAPSPKPQAAAPAKAVATLALAQS